MAEENALGREIHRVVTAPYAVSLKTLHHLALKSTSASIQQWAENKPCHVNVLASVVLDGLSFWPEALEILCAFGAVSIFRDAVLRRQPMLLDTILLKATTSSDNSQKCSKACIAMLSTPLADDFAVPASLPPFLLKLIKIMVERPCGDMIRPLYQVLGGIQPLLLEVLPDESMEHFQTECTKVLRGLDDHIGNLLCLATLARIASAASTTSTTSSSSPPSISDLEWSAPKPRTWQQNVFQFFNAMRGSKTLDIVVLRVILASSGSSDLSLGASIEGLKLAKEILEVVEPDQRKAWVKAHAAKVAKLLGKIQQPGLPPALQAAAIAFLVSLLDADKIPSQILSLIRRLILWHGREGTLSLVSDLLNTSLIEKIAPQFGQDIVNALLNFCVVESRLEYLPCNRTLESTHLLLSLLQGLSAALEGSVSMKERILAFQTEPEFPGLKEGLIDFSKADRQPDCGNHGTCDLNWSNAQNKLITDLCVLFLKAALPEVNTQVDGAPGALLSASNGMLSMLRNRQTSRLICSFSHVKFKFRGPTASLLEQISTPYNDSSSHDWRSNLAEDLLRDASRSHESIMRRVGEVCRDLEARCETVEQPLQKANMDIKSLEENLQAANARISELEGQATERNSFIGRLENEKSKAEDQTRHAEGRIETLSERLQNIWDEFDAAKKDAEHAKESAKEHARNKDLEYRANLAAKEETVDEQMQKTSQLEAELGSLRRSLERTSEQLASVTEENSSLKTELSHKQQSLEAEKELNAQKDEDIGKLQENNESSQVIIANLQQKLDRAAEDSENLRKAVGALRESLDGEVAILDGQIETERLQVAEETKTRDLQHDQKIRSIQAALKDAETNAQSESQIKDTKIDGLERKVGRLLEERAARAREFAEAQKLSSKLMALMGADNNLQTAVQSSNYGSDASGLFLNAPELQEDIGDSPTKSHRNKQRSDSALRGSFESSTSSKSGRTPKRAKSSRNTKTSASRHQVRMSVGSRTIRTTHAARLRPLGEVGANSSYRLTRPSGKSLPLGRPKKFHDDQIENQVSSQPLADMDDVSFSDNDVFTSTAPANQAPYYGGLDDTTADF